MSGNASVQSAISRRRYAPDPEDRRAALENLINIVFQGDAGASQEAQRYLIAFENLDVERPRAALPGISNDNENTYAA